MSLTTSSITSGDNTTAHVITVSVLGGALSTVTCWLISLAHIVTPAAVEAAFGIIFSVAASWIMQKISG